MRTAWRASSTWRIQRIQLNWCGDSGTSKPTRGVGQGPKFAVVLRPPKGEAKLELKFTLHDTIVNKLGPVTVSAKVNGVQIDPETFSKPGDYVYSHDVPASALGADVVQVDFTTDKSLEPTEQDKRELSLIVKSIGLVAKQ